MAFRFNPPPGWPEPRDGWLPPEGWIPDPSWPPAPRGWQFITDDGRDRPVGEKSSGGVIGWAKQHPVLVVAAVVVTGVLLAKAGGGTPAAAETSGSRSAQTDTSAESYENQVDVKLTGCEQDYDGRFYADLRITNSSPVLMKTYVLVSFFDGDVMVQQTNDYPSVPAGTTAERHVDYYSDTGIAEDLRCEVTEVSPSAV